MPCTHLTLVSSLVAPGIFSHAIFTLAGELSDFVYPGSGYSNSIKFEMDKGLGL